MKYTASAGALNKQVAVYEWLPPTTLLTLVHLITKEPELVIHSSVQQVICYTGRPTTTKLSKSA